MDLLVVPSKVNAMILFFSFFALLVLIWSQRFLLHTSLAALPLPTCGQSPDIVHLHKIVEMHLLYSTALYSTLLHLLHSTALYSTLLHLIYCDVVMFCSTIYSIYIPGEVLQLSVYKQFRR